MKRLTILLSALVLGTVGCMDLGTIQELERGFEAAQDQLVLAQRTQDELRIELESLHGAERERAERALEKQESVVEALAKYTDLGQDVTIRVREALEASPDVPTIIEVTGREVGAVIPQPAGTIITIVSGLVAAFMTARARASRKTGQRATLSVSPYLTPEAKAALSETQDDAVKRLVDEAQGKKLTLF